MDHLDPLREPPPFAIPPFGAYIRRDEQVRVTSYNALASVVLTVRARVLRPEGGISDSVDTTTPNTDRTAKTLLVRCDEGWLLDGQVVVTTATPLLGHTFVVVEVVRGDLSSPPATRVLAAGYVTAKQPLLFPQPTIANSLDGAGAIRVIAGATPAAGAELAETVPTGARWELLAFAFRFVTSAVVANRSVAIVFDDGTNLYSGTSWNALIAASSTVNFRSLPGSAAPWNDQGGNAYIPTLSGLRMLAGHRMRSSTTNLQVADQFSSLFYIVREWIEGA